MISNDIEKAFKILKNKKNLGNKDVAEVWAVSEGHVSKVRNGSKALTWDNFRAFNDAYSDIVSLDPSVVKEPMDMIQLNITVNALSRTVQDLLSISLGTREFVVERVADRDNVSRESVLSEMGRLGEDEVKKVRSGSTPNG